jgi:hypothetical protein
MHIMQPLARLRGRLRFGLTLWRRRGLTASALPSRHNPSIWSEVWHDIEEWLLRVEKRLKENGAVVQPGGDFDDWDLELRGGMLGRARMRMTVEEHGAGRQMLRFQIRPRYSLRGIVPTLITATLAVAAAADGARPAAAALFIATALILIAMLRESAAAIGTLLDATSSITVDDGNPSRTEEGIREMQSKGTQEEGVLPVIEHPLSISSITTLSTQIDGEPQLELFHPSKGGVHTRKEPIEESVERS